MLAQKGLAVQSAFDELAVEKNATEVLLGPGRLKEYHLSLCAHKGRGLGGYGVRRDTAGHLQDVYRRVTGDQTAVRHYSTRKPQATASTSYLSVGARIATSSTAAQNNPLSLYI